MNITPEIKLYRAMINKAIEDSLLEPLSGLPDYTTDDTGSVEWRRIRDKRRTLNEREYWRQNARHGLMDPYMDILYAMCYHESIDGLRDQLAWIWEEIDADPSKSKMFISKFNCKAGHHKAGGIKKGQRKKVKDEAQSS